MKHTFQVGDRVVCVDAHETARFGGVWHQELQEGAVYTVAWVGVDRGQFDSPYGREAVCVRLNEVKRAKYLHREVGFAAARFRPVRPLSFWLGEKQALELEKRE